MPDQATENNREREGRCSICADSTHSNQTRRHRQSDAEDENANSIIHRPGFGKLSRKFRN